MGETISTYNSKLWYIENPSSSKVFTGTVKCSLSYIPLPSSRIFIMFESLSHSIYNHWYLLWISYFTIFSVVDMLTYGKTQTLSRYEGLLDFSNSFLHLKNNQTVLYTDRNGTFIHINGNLLSKVGLSVYSKFSPCNSLQVKKRVKRLSSSIFLISLPEL